MSGSSGGNHAGEGQVRNHGWLTPRRRANRDLVCDTTKPSGAPLASQEAPDVATALATLEKTLPPRDDDHDSVEVPRTEADLPIAEASSAEGVPTADDAWSLRPWRERVQPTDVAIAGLVLVLGLVSALVFFLGQPSTAPGSRPLAVSQPSSHPGSSSEPSKDGGGTSTGSSEHSPVTRSGSSTTGSIVQTPIVHTLSSQSTTGTAPTSSSTTQATTPTTNSTPTTNTTTAPAGAASAPPCTPGDFTITTVTDNSSYSASSPVTVTTQIVDKSACSFNPVAPDQSSCPTTVVISNAVGMQVYPMPGQGEQCAAVSQGTLTPGSTRTVKIVWNQPDPNTGGPTAAPGQYTATGTWSWKNQSGSPYQESASSQSFIIGP